MPAKYLKKSDFSSLDDKIDEVIKNSPFLLIPRDVALFHILLAYEKYSTYIDKNADLSYKNIAIQKAFRALNHSVILIYKYCPIIVKNERLQFNSTVADEAAVFFSEAEKYSILWVEMTKLHKGRNKCLIIDKDYYEFSPATLHNEEMDCSRGLIDHYDDPQKSDDVQNVTFETVLDVYNRLFITWNGRLKFSYTYANEVFLYLKSKLIERSLLQWSMDGSWDLGGYTFDQVKEFWFTLQTISLIHQIALNHISVERHRKTLALQIRSFQDWVNDISKKSNLSVETCSLILNDLIYNEKLYQRPKKKSPHVMYQPFFRLQSGDIAVCARIVQVANIERNIFSLADVIPKPTIDELKNRKEAYWIKELKEMLKNIGLQCFPNLDYKTGEIDLLIIDDKLKFGLVCELKWLTFSDDVSGVTNNDKVILEKISQATKGVNWINSNVDRLSQKIGISEKILKQIDFKPLFILKESFASGFIERTKVPVINDKLFSAILSQPLSQNIKNLWEIANSQSYIAKKNEHFRDSIQTIFWGKMKFKVNGVTILKRWNPQTDIKGLTKGNN